MSDGMKEHIRALRDMLEYATKDRVFDGMVPPYFTPKEWREALDTVERALAQPKAIVQGTTEQIGGFPFTRDAGIRTPLPQWCGQHGCTLPRGHPSEHRS